MNPESRKKLMLFLLKNANINPSLKVAAMEFAEAILEHTLPSAKQDMILSHLKEILLMTLGANKVPEAYL